MTIEKIPITQEQFDLLKTTENWNIDEVDKKFWDKIPGIQRLQDTIAIMASGSFSDPRIMHFIDNIVAGIDVLAHEPKPKINKKEKEGNAYHYVFQKTGKTELPYIMHGPYRTETIVPHWFDCKDIDSYWKIDDE